MLAPLSLYCTPGMSVESSSRLARALRRARPILHRVLVQLLSRRRRQSTGGTRARNPAPPPLPPARPRMKWGLRTAPTWRTATASTREREREGRGVGCTQSCLPHRRCMDVQLIRPLSPSSLSRQFAPQSSSSLSCSFFIWHQNTEERSPALNPRPRARGRTHFRRGGDSYSGEGRR